MADTLLNLIKAVGGVDNFIRLLWAGTFLIIASSLYFFSRSVYANAQRGNPALETLHQVVLRLHQEVADITAERRSRDIRINELNRHISRLDRLIAGVQYENMRLKEEIKLQRDEP